MMTSYPIEETSKVVFTVLSSSWRYDQQDLTAEPWWSAESLSSNLTLSPFRLPARLCWVLEVPSFPEVPARSVTKENTGSRHGPCQRAVRTMWGRGSINYCRFQNCLGPHTCHMHSDLTTNKVIPRISTLMAIWTRDSWWSKFYATCPQKMLLSSLPIRARKSPFPGVRRWTA